MDIIRRYRLTAAALALLTGIFGIHRFYLGQYLRGMLYLCYPFLLITVGLYVSGTLDIIRDQVSVEGLDGLWYALLPFSLVPLFDAWRLFRMTDGRFQERYSVPAAHEKRLLVSLLAFIAGITFNLLWYSLFFANSRPDTTGAPDASFTPAGLVAAYGEGYQSWQGKVVRVTGTLVEEEIEFTEAGERHSWIVGPADMPVLCRIHADFAAEAAVWQVGEQHTLQGWVEADLSNKIILEDCRPVP